MLVKSMKPRMKRINNTRPRNKRKRLSVTFFKAFFLQKEFYLNTLRMNTPARASILIITPITIERKIYGGFSDELGVTLGSPIPEKSRVARNTIRVIIATKTSTSSRNVRFSNFYKLPRRFF
jgi:hypothetical protein